MAKKPLIKPDVPAVSEWAGLLDKSYAQNTFSNYGPLSRQLTTEIDAMLGGDGKTTLPVANATVGLQIALQALGHRSGKVITQAFTFPATVNAILAAGLEPVFLDVAQDSWQVQPEVLDRALRETGDVVAVMVVRTLGLCAGVEQIERICARHDVPLILDSAGCFGGAEASGRKIGLAGLAEVFSFHATKPFSVGEGGCIYGDTAFVEKCRIASNFGLEGTNLLSLGTNAKMAEMAAAVALARMQGFAENVVAPRTAKAAHYRARLAGCNQVSFPADIGHPTWQFFPIRLASAELAAQVIAALDEAGYLTRTYYKPALHETAFYGQVPCVGAMEVSGRLSREVVVLPLHSDIGEADIDRVTGVILDCCGAS